MTKYKFEVYRTNNLPSRNDFQRLVAAYNAFSFSDTMRDDELLGECHDVFAEYDGPLDMNVLQNEFPRISITGLEPLHI